MDGPLFLDMCFFCPETAFPGGCAKVFHSIKNLTVLVCDMSEHAKHIIFDVTTCEPPFCCSFKLCLDIDLNIRARDWAPALRSQENVPLETGIFDYSVW